MKGEKEIVKLDTCPGRAVDGNDSRGELPKDPRACLHGSRVLATGPSFALLASVRPSSPTRKPERGSLKPPDKKIFTVISVKADRLLPGITSSVKQSAVKQLVSVPHRSVKRDSRDPFARTSTLLAAIVPNGAVNPDNPMNILSPERISILGINSRSTPTPRPAKRRSGCLIRGPVKDTLAASPKYPIAPDTNIVGSAGPTFSSSSKNEVFAESPLAGSRNPCDSGTKTFTSSPETSLRTRR